MEAGALARYLAGRPPAPARLARCGRRGVNPAARLGEAGRQVRRLDYGNTDHHYVDMIPHKSFSEIRRTEPDQHRWFLGEHFEGIPFGGVRVGAQLTPPRMHI